MLQEIDHVPPSPPIALISPAESPIDLLSFSISPIPLDPPAPVKRKREPDSPSYDRDAVPGAVEERLSSVARRLAFF